MNELQTTSLRPSEARVIVAGIGGQGVIFITRVLAQTAATLGLPAIVSEVHGMSQRGGSVNSHLKIGVGEAPLIRSGTADLLFALDELEGLRNLPFLRRGGTLLVNAEPGLPFETVAHLAHLEIAVLSVPATHIATELGAPGVANVVLMGFLAAHFLLPLPFDAVRDTLTEAAPRQRDLNLQAVEAGCRAAWFLQGRRLRWT